MKIINCPNCDMKYRIDPAKFKQPELKIRCKKCEEVFAVDLSGDAGTPEPPAPSPPQSEPQQQEQTQPSSDAPAQSAAGGSDNLPSADGKGQQALVAHENAEMLSTMESILKERGFEVLTANNGVDALNIIEKQQPGVAVLDVALPKVFGFEICEIVRRDPELEHVRLLLIAAIYDHTKYKRSPSSLYGADDYIEKHHIPDSLGDKVARLAGGETQPDTREEEAPPMQEPDQEAQDEAVRQQIRDQEVAPQVDEESANRARRLARTIVSDIALYNQEKIEEGVKGGNLRELLAHELDEGRQLLSERLGDEFGDIETYLNEALDTLIERKREEYGV